MLPRAVGCNLVGLLEQLGVNGVAHNQPINAILARVSALVASDRKHGKLAGKSRNVISRRRGHHNLPFLGVVLGAASEAASHLTPRDDPREHNAGSGNTNGDDDHAQAFTQAHDRFIPVSVT